MKTYKEGDLVRVSRAPTYSLPYGIVATVVQMGGWSGYMPGFILVDAPDGYRESVRLDRVKLAKQATKKRDEYAARR